MDKTEQMALQTAKEIVVKFVETGRISPSNFAEHFNPIYREILRTIAGGEELVPTHSGQSGQSGQPGQSKPEGAKADKAKPAPGKSAPAKEDQGA